MRRRLLVSALLLGLGPVSAEENLTAVVSLADGNTVPLQPWTFSYEYSAQAKGAPAGFAPLAHRELKVLWLGKRSVEAAGLTLEIVYQTVDREQDEGGESKTVAVPVARELRLVSGGKTSVARIEPPSREVLAPEGKDVLPAPRSLDLRGQTLSGTNVSYCLASYTSLVECGSDPAHQVTRVEFH
jgi:hypothetical protein